MLVTIEVVENEVFVVDADGVRENTVQSRSLEIDAYPVLFGQTWAQALSSRRNRPTLVGSLGLVPSVNAGDNFVMGEPCVAFAIPVGTCES